MKYRILVCVAAVAFVAICLFGSKAKVVSAVPVSTPKVVTSTPEKINPTEPKTYEVSFTAVVSSPTP